MAAGSVTVHIYGMEGLRAKLRSGRAEAPIKRFMDRCAGYTQGQARLKAPVHDGYLRDSISFTDPTPRSRSVGPNKHYAPYVEFGTRPHWPPIGAITPWANKHHIDPYVLARTIARKGTKPHPYMAPAANAARGFIPSLMPVFKGEIEAEFMR